MISGQRHIYTLLFVITLAVSACKPAVPQSPAMDMISDFVTAYNAQDAVGMLAFAHPDIEWIYTTGSEVIVTTRGREAMTEEIEEHFNGPNKVTSTLSGWGLNGNFVSVKETVSWVTKEGEKKEQASIAVYEIEDNLIRRVWYFPEQRE